MAVNILRTSSVVALADFIHTLRGVISLSLPSDGTSDSTSMMICGPDEYPALFSSSRIAALITF